MVLLNLTLSIVILVFAIVGLLFNIYLVLALVLAKQVTKPRGNVLLLLLGVHNTFFTSIYLCVASPSLANDAFVLGENNNILCSVQAIMFFIMHSLIAWNIAGVHLDRFVSVAYPLRYSSIMSWRKIGSFISSMWAISVLVFIFFTPSMTYDQSIGLCSPNFVESRLFTLIYSGTGAVAPVVFVLVLNLKIVRIAKYHQFRIANALLGMAFTSDHYLSEGAKARERQKKALKNFQGYHAVGTLFQLVGTLGLFYFPFAGVSVFSSFANDHVGVDLAKRLSFVSIMLSPIWNTYIFGLKNKGLQTTLVNFARKEMMKSEVHQEIRLRSPGANGFTAPAGSARPSLASIIGHITLQMPTYIHRQLSVSSLAPDGTNSRNESLRLSRSSPSVSIKRRRSLLFQRLGLRRTGSGRMMHPVSSTQDLPCKRDNSFVKPPLVRHASDLTWHDLHKAKIVETDDVSFQVGSKMSLSVPEASSLTLEQGETDSSFPRRASSPSLCCVSAEDGDFSRGSFSGNSSSRLCDEKPKELINVVRTVSAACLANLSSVEVSRMNNLLSQSCSNLAPGNIPGRKGSPPCLSRKRSRSIHASVTGLAPLRKVQNKAIGLNQSFRKSGKPKITITRAPTIDQSRLDFLPKHHHQHQLNQSGVNNNNNNNHSKYHSRPKKYVGANGTSHVYQASRVSAMKKPTVAIINENKINSTIINGSSKATIEVHMADIKGGQEFQI